MKAIAAAVSETWPWWFEQLNNLEEDDHSYTTLSTYSTCLLDALLGKVTVRASDSTSQQRVKYTPTVPFERLDTDYRTKLGVTNKGKRLVPTRQQMETATKCLKSVWKYCQSV